jgi:hypothetical protein
MRHTPLWGLAGVFLALALVVTAGCDQDYPTGGYDVVIDTPVDTPVPDVAPDAPPDAAGDPVTEPEPDPEEDTPEPCEYPAGPYSFNSVGDTVGPASWPTAVSGSEETMPADFSVLYCDESVESIFVVLVTTS